MYLGHPLLLCYVTAHVPLMFLIPGRHTLVAYPLSLRSSFFVSSNRRLAHRFLFGYSAMTACLLSVPADVVERLLLLLGPTTAPILSATVRGLVPPAAVMALQQDLARAAEFFQVPTDVPAASGSLLLDFCRCCAALHHSMVLPLRRLNEFSGLQRAWGLRVSDCRH